jgi:methylmalonyl-CoA/ethylmalonyl-CoA epimerase
MKFHHIGVATENIELTANIYELLGYKKGELINDPLQKVKLCFLKKIGFPMVELVSPADITSPVNTILKKNGTIPYHTCYEVFDLEDKIIYLKKNKFILVVKPIAAVAFGNRRVCFLYHKGIGLIELLEKGI